MEQKTPIDWKKIGRIAVICVAAALVLLTVLTCLYTVDDKQQAVVTTFGKVTDVTDAGLHFKLPFGIQQVRKVDVNVYQKIELGYASTNQNGNYLTNTNESTMITTSSTWTSSSSTRSPTPYGFCTAPTIRS